MRYLTRKDKKARKNVSKKQLDNHIIKSICKNNFLPQTIQWKANSLFSQHKKKYFKNRIRNRCILTGRNRSVFGFSKLSRLSFTHLLKSGNICNMKKSSW